VAIQKRKDKLQKVYEGVIDLDRRPDVLFIIGLSQAKTAFEEAKKNNIPVIAVCNTDCNPRLVDYVIPGNDKSEKSISFFANLVAEVIGKNKEAKNN
jgi:small subunit ribosomal protein S2